MTMPTQGSGRNKTCPSPTFDARSLRNGKFWVVTCDPAPVPASMLGVKTCYSISMLVHYQPHTSIIFVQAVCMS